ncbi:DUF421 domain-containing protein [Radiobacillus kanasensis]|nr:DUF421 domain-containing protein [Radiobacillus kanasensis]UFU01343.1 DUF421 domain-containing protein [Radiobacillus kanasensis]
MTPGSIIIETLFGFFALLIITKLLGKTQITQLTAFDFISAMIFGELVGNVLFDDKAGLKEMALAVFLWGGLLYIINWSTQKFKKTRELFEGKPTLIIHQGKISKKSMKKSKLDINQLMHLLRSKGAFSIQEVEYAVLETDGSISILKASNNQPPTRQDLSLPEQKVSIPIILIADGEVLWDNVRESGFDRNWLEKKLKEQKYNSVKDVFFAEFIAGEGLYVQPY